MDYRKILDEYFIESHRELVAIQDARLRDKQISQYRRDYEVRRLDKWMRIMTTESEYPLSALISLYKAEAKEGRGPFVNLL